MKKKQPKKNNQKKTVFSRRKADAPKQEPAERTPEPRTAAEPRETRKRRAEKERSAVFKRRVKNAGTRKAPVTQRTRGYYRFTKDYPAEVDSDGLRKNGEDPVRKRRRGLLIAGLMAGVCLLAFFMTKTAWYLAAREPETQPTAAPEASPAVMTGALRIEADELTAAAADAALTQANLGIAVLEYKTENGNLHNGNEALIAALHETDRKAAAYISCFKDTLGAVGYPELAVTPYNGEADFWQDNAGNGWLNPFSAAAKAYILEVIAAAAAEGFDYILLDNVCFPSDSGAGTAYFAGEGDYAGTRNQLLRGFIGDAVTAAGAAGTILMCKYAAFDPEAPADKAPYYGNLLGTGAGSMCADARLSLQQKNITIGEEKFTDPASIPFAFMLAVAQMAGNNAEGANIYLCMENGDTAADGLRAAQYTRATGYILW